MDVRFTNYLEGWRRGARDKPIPSEYAADADYRDGWTEGHARLKEAVAFAHATYGVSSTATLPADVDTAITTAIDPAGPTETVDATLGRRGRHAPKSPQEALDAKARIQRGELKR